MKVVYCSKGTGLFLSDQAEQELSERKGTLSYYSASREVCLARHDKDLVEIVERLRCEAGDKFNEFSIYEVQGQHYAILGWDDGRNGYEVVLDKSEIDFVDWLDASHAPEKDLEKLKEKLKESK